MTQMTQMKNRYVWGVLLLAVPGAVGVAQEAARTERLSPDTLFFAEGLDVDPRTGALYVTSIRHGTVMRYDARGEWTAALDPRGERIAAVFGVAVDTVRDCLWLTTAPHARRAVARVEAVAAGDTETGDVGTGKADEGTADSLAAGTWLLRVNLGDGRITGRWSLGAGAGMPGELAVAPNGDVIVSDGIHGALYRLRAPYAALDIVRDPLLRSPQGIAVRDDGRVAWVADWSRGIVRWDLEHDVMTRVEASDGAVLRGVDGLRLMGSWLIGVQNGATPGRVIGVRLDDEGRKALEVRVLDRSAPGAGEPTVGAVLRGEFVYVTSSQWPFWTDDGTRRGEAPLPSVQIRRVRIDGLPR